MIVLYFGNAHGVTLTIYLYQNLHPKIKFTMEHSFKELPSPLKIKMAKL